MGIYDKLIILINTTPFFSGGINFIKYICIKSDKYEKN